MTARVVLLAVASLLLLAACGGGGGGGDGEGADTSAQTPGSGAPAGKILNEEGFRAELAYQEGIQTCSYYTLKEVAATYNAKPTPQAVADAVAASKEGSPAVKDAARKGCLDALKGEGK